MAPAESRTEPPTEAQRSSPLRPVLLSLLLLSAAAALFVQPRVVAAVRAESLETWWLLVTPALFAVVTALAAVDAWRVARKRGYFRGRSVVVVAACIVVLGLLLPRVYTEYRARTTPADESARLDKLSTHQDPRVRALVMDVAGYRPGPQSDGAALLLRGLDDPDPLVVRAAVHAVAHRSREAMDSVEGPEAVERARELARAWSTGAIDASGSGSGPGGEATGNAAGGATGSAAGGTTGGAADAGMVEGRPMEGRP